MAAFGSDDAVVGVAACWAAFLVTDVGATVEDARTAVSIAGTRSASFGASALAARSVGSLMPVALPSCDVTLSTSRTRVVLAGLLGVVDGFGVGRTVVGAGVDGLTVGFTVVVGFGVIVGFAVTVGVVAGLVTVAVGDGLTVVVGLLVAVAVALTLGLAVVGALVGALVGVGVGVAFVGDADGEGEGGFGIAPIALSGRTAGIGEIGRRST